MSRNKDVFQTECTGGQWRGQSNMQRQLIPEFDGWWVRGFYLIFASAQAQFCEHQYVLLSHLIWQMHQLLLCHLLLPLIFLIRKTCRLFGNVFSSPKLSTKVSFWLYLREENQPSVSELHNKGLDEIVAHEVLKFLRGGKLLSKLKSRLKWFS